CLLPCTAAGDGLAGSFAGVAGPMVDHCASHAHPFGLLQLFVLLMQLLPHALPFVQTLQQAAAGSGGAACSVTIGVRWPWRQSHGAVNAPRQMPRPAACAVCSCPT